MVVRQNMTLLIDYRPRASAFCRRGNHEEPIVADGADKDVHHASIGILINPNVGQFLQA